MNSDWNELLLEIGKVRFRKHRVDSGISQYTLIDFQAQLEGLTGVSTNLVDTTSLEQAVS